MHMSNIISILDQRATIASGGLEQKLCSIAHDIIKLSSEHQKRVLKIMQEFDLHDEKHLVKVEENIADILESKGLDSFNSLDLFIIIAASYLHDCGMAPADWEITTMSLTEGNEKYCIEKSSVKNDGKKPFSFAEARTFVIQHKRQIYDNFGSIRDWFFAPSTEEDLINNLTELLIDYQDFRNGYTDRLASVSDIYDFGKLNNEIRLDFIRIHHHKKSEEYVKNLKPLFKSLGEGWSDRLVIDLSRVCRAHGETLDYVRALKNTVKYVGDDSVNLQFAAQMLRLGDIIHYSNDRAPSVIRLATKFSSEYSKHEWGVKIGLNYSIKDSSICFMANCQNPTDYYHLHEYLDWIDEEILNLDTLKKQWDLQYKLELHEVDRSNVDYDHEAFRPVLGKKFSLSQNKIIDLLMGVNLYKDPFSCIRELYQNSLDACRCRMSIAQSSGYELEGRIEFYLENKDGVKFLCCKDNGLGMSEYVIENYLLKIGNSYYRSADFNRRISVLGNPYTPISQFGIGILACFIIGTRLEIITHSFDTNEYLTCCIEGAKENFYYRNTTREEQEALVNSGTIVKIQLKPEYESKINSTFIDKLGIVLQYHYDNNLPESFIKYKSIFEIWEHSLYKYLNEYVSQIPKGIKLYVVFANNQKVALQNKPLALHIGQLGITEEDIPFIDTVIENSYFRHHDVSLCGIQQYIRHYPINILTEEISYSTILSLPLEGLPKDKEGNFTLRALRVNGSHICVDGISVSANSDYDDPYYSRLVSYGSINYIGKVRPSLSVDRKSIVEYPRSYRDDYKSVTIQEISEIIRIAKQHIDNYNLSNNSEVLDSIWESIFHSLGCAQVLFVNYLANSDLGDFVWSPLSQMIGDNISVREILSAKEIVLSGYDHTKQDMFTQKLIMSLLMGASSIEALNENTIRIQKGANSRIPELNMELEHHRYIVPSENCSVFDEYDIVSNLYPLVPKRLIDALKFERGKVKFSNAMIVSAYSNCYNELFFQDSRLVNPQIGLYRNQSNFFKKPDCYIHKFDTLKNNFQCMDFIPDYHIQKKVVPILAYIHPRELTEKDKSMIEQFKETEPDYYKGVYEGWTVLVTNMEKENVIIKPGKVSRDSMVASLSNEFWKEYQDWSFFFLDGKEMLPITKVK